MVKIYKGHVIRISSVEATLNQWDLRIEVIWPESGVHKIRTFPITRRFKTYDQAIIRGHIWAKRWIDDGKPDRPSTDC